MCFEFFFRLFSWKRAPKKKENPAILKEESESKDISTASHEAPTDIVQDSPAQEGLSDLIEDEQCQQDVVKENGSLTETSPPDDLTKVVSNEEQSLDKDEKCIKAEESNSPVPNSAVLNDPLPSSPISKEPLKQESPEEVKDTSPVISVQVESTTESLEVKQEASPSTLPGDSEIKDISSAPVSSPVEVSAEVPSEKVAIDLAINSPVKESVEVNPSNEVASLKEQASKVEAERKSKESLNAGNEDNAANLKSKDLNVETDDDKMKKKAEEINGEAEEVKAKTPETKEEDIEKNVENEIKTEDKNEVDVPVINDKESSEGIKTIAEEENTSNEIIDKTPEKSEEMVANKEIEAKVDEKKENEFMEKHVANENLNAASPTEIKDVPAEVKEVGISEEGINNAEEVAIEKNALDGGIDNMKEANDMENLLNEENNHEIKENDAVQESPISNEEVEKLSPKSSIEENTGLEEIKPFDSATLKTAKELSPTYEPNSPILNDEPKLENEAIDEEGQQETGSESVSR